MATIRDHNAVQSDKAGRADFPTLKMTLSWFSGDRMSGCLDCQGHGKVRRRSLANMDSARLHGYTRGQILVISR